MQDIVLRGSSSDGAARAAATYLGSTTEALGRASTIEELHSLLGQESVRALSGAHAQAVNRCVQYVGGLAKEQERILCGWPVLSINEWGQQQVRSATPCPAERTLGSQCRSDHAARVGSRRGPPSSRSFTHSRACGDAGLRYARSC